jgi:mRNA-degrading endonuclease RelE of RelBE toxin-antitoxin system
MSHKRENKARPEVRVLITREAQKEFNELPAEMKFRAQEIFERLRNWPLVSGAKGLGKELAGQYRIRTGKYRVQFRVNMTNEDEKEVTVVTIVKIGHREGFYE